MSMLTPGFCECCGAVIADGQIGDCEECKQEEALIERCGGIDSEEYQQIEARRWAAVSALNQAQVS